MQLYRAETPGPVKDSKLTPRIAGTAKALWYIYLGLTTACALAYWGAGMNLFDAISHSFSTVAIGGFSTHDASIGYFDNSTIELICVLFMLISGVNFSLHFAAVRGLSIDPYNKDPEFKVYLSIMVLVTVLAAIVLMTQGGVGFSDAISDALFHTVYYCDNNRFCNGKLFNLANLFTGAFGIRQLYRWMCGFDRWWHESHSLFVVI